MSVWSRFANLFRSDRLRAELDEELQFHIEQSIADGRDPNDARKAFGSPIRYREASRDLKINVWLDSLRADFVFGWRQIRKKPAISAAAILSLRLAIGSCTAVFRLIDALLLRPLPVAHADRLFAMVLRGVGPSGELRDSDSNAYPLFLLMRSMVRQDAELIGASWTERADLTFASEAEMEKATAERPQAWYQGLERYCWVVCSERAGAAMVMYGFNFRKLFSPTPLTFIRSSSFLNPPFFCRYSTIRSAVALPIPGSPSS